MMVPSLIAAALLALAASSAGAAPLHTGTTAGSFANPVLAGTVVSTDGSIVAVDNTSTASYSGVGSAALRWGNFDTVQFPGVVPPGVRTHSDLVFTGSAYAVDAGATFTLGRLSYSNGSSSNDTLVFGAALSVATGAAPTPFVLDIGFHATVNGNVSAIADADYLSLAGIPGTLHAFEGGTATAELLGRFDPGGQLALVGLRLAGLNPDGSTSSGYIGRDGRSVPVPGTLALLALGLGGLGALRRKAG